MSLSVMSAAGVPSWSLITICLILAEEVQLMSRGLNEVLDRSSIQMEWQKETVWVPFASYLQLTGSTQFNNLLTVTVFLCILLPCMSCLLCYVISSSLYLLIITLPSVPISVFMVSFSGHPSWCLISFFFSFVSGLSSTSKPCSSFQYSLISVKKFSGV